MTANRIFTRQAMGLDYRVWRAMLLLIILSLGLISYRLIDSKKCSPVNFSIKTIAIHTDSTYSVGETLSFISTANKNEIIWDFGDNSDKITGQYVTHTFAQTGSYNITATTGTSCETTKPITIIPVLVIQSKDNSLVVGEEIVGPASTMAGKEESFFCMATATAYEWSIPNYPKMIQSGPTAKFQFPTAGKYMVQVTLDHDRTKRYSKEITVEAAPVVKTLIPQDIKPLLPESVQPLPPPETNSTVKIADAIFLGYLEKVIDKKMTAPDFDNYLCYKGETKVISNGELMSFSAFCEEISGKKRRKMIIGKTKIKIKVAEMRRDKDGCVNIIEVKYH